jgi:hypothetical protein
MNLLLLVYDDMCKEKNFSLSRRNVNREGFPVHEWVFKDCSMLQLPVKGDILRVDLIRLGVECRVMSKSEALLLWNEAEQYFNREYREEDRKFLRSRGTEGPDLMPDQVLSDSAERQQHDQLLEAPKATQAPPQPQYQTPPHAHNAPPQATTAPPSPTTTPARFGTGRYDWAAIILIPLVILLIVGAEDSHPSIAAIVGAVFLAVIGFLLFLKKHRWLSLLPFLMAFVFMGSGPETDKPTPIATVSVATDSTPTPKFAPVVPYSPTFSTLKTGTAVTVYNDDGSENSSPWEVNWITYGPIPKGATQTCPREDFVNEKLAKLDNCQPIPKGATGRARDIYGVWFYVKMIPPVPNTENVPSEGNAKAQY